MAALLTACATPPAGSARFSRGFWGTLEDDVAHAPSTLWNDAVRAARDRDVWLPLTVAGGVAAVTKADGGRMDEFFFERSILSSDVSGPLDLYGSGALLLGSTATWYLGSLALGEEESYEDSKVMFRALAVTGLTTTALKVIFDDTRPDGGSYGFPSGHSSMAMAAATTLQDLYGYRAGIPAFLSAGFVGLQRLDDSRHDLGDVLFGWTLGYVIAHSITQGKNLEVLGMDLGVHIDPVQDYAGFSLTLR